MITLTIHDLGSDGEGVGHFNGFVIFVERGLPGEVVKARLTEVKKNYAKGVIEDVIEASPLRERPLCSVYEQCGGCQLQHLSYEGQLLAKQKRIKDALERIGHLKNIKVNPCISSNPWAYRNKIQLPVVMSAHGINIGFYRHRSHDVIDIDSCPIHCKKGDEIFQKIKKLLLKSSVQPYHEISSTGELRYCLIKTAVSSGEVLVTLVLKGEASAALKTLAEIISSSCPEVKGIVQNINDSPGNVILGKEYRTLLGRPYIYETLGGFTYKISSASFFQVNTFQAERLYEYAITLADIQRDETVIDAYCGVGTLSLFLAKRAKKVIGIECVSEAIFDAQANAKSNHVENVQFHCVHTEKATHLLNQGNVIFLNPPRGGCETSVIRDLVRFSQTDPNKNDMTDFRDSRIIYISCNPATLARDLFLLTEGGYKISEVQPFDMFPQTAHVETVVLLTRSRIFQTISKDGQDVRSHSLTKKSGVRK